MADPDGKNSETERERNESGASSLKSTKDRARPPALEMTDGAEASRNASIKQKKLGHRGVDDHGNTVYKKTATTTLMAAIQLGIQHSVGGLSAKPERDVLLQDFAVVESVFFPKEGSNITQAHQCPDFRFKTYAPVAFRYFRDLFGIQPDDFMISLVDQPLRELSNPGASGSVFYLSNDDEFIIKTVQHKEADFLQKLLPGYYMNLNQNPRTLLPKFYGLYTYQSGGRNIRMIVMNNLLPSHLKMHQKFDLKGSTFKRKSSKSERKKASPTLKDLDFLDEIPEGLLLDAHTYNALSKTLQRDCRVLESFKIMDYSLLVAIHNLDQAEREGGRITPTFNGGDSSSPPPPETPKSVEPPSIPETPHDFGGEDSSSHPKGAKLERSFSKLRKIAKHVTTREAIQGQSETYMPDTEESCGGIPAKNSKGERLLLFLGIIDILQCYKVKKKLEHTYKALIHDGDTVSVCRPDFYAKRFQEFMLQKVFKKIPPPKHSPSKRRGQAGFYGSSGGRERRRTGESMKDHHSLERGTLPPTTLDKPPISGGAKPKTSRPDLVPSTPPNSEKDAELVDSPRDQPSESTPSNKKDQSASELSVQTDEGAVSTRRSPERVTVHSSSVNEPFDLTQPGSSTLDDTASESSPHKSSNLSVESLGAEGVLSDPEKTPTAVGIADPEKTPVAENNFAEGMRAYQREESESRTVIGEEESFRIADENDIELDMKEKDSNSLQRESSVRSGTEGDSWL